MSETPAAPETAAEAAPEPAAHQAPESDTPVLTQPAGGPVAAPAAAPGATAAPPPAPARITFQSMADRLTLGLLASVIGAVLVFVSAFLTWSTVDARSQVGDKLAGAVTDSIGIAGGRLGTATLVLSLAALAVVAVMLLPATKPWAWQVLIGAGALSAAFALYDLFSIPRTLRPDNFTCPAGVSCTFHRTIGPGVWFTLIASLIIVAGAYIHHIRPVPFRSPGAHPARRPVVDLTKS